MAKYVEIYRKDPNNIGDVFSNPLRYFAKGEKVDSVDIINVKGSIYTDNVPVVVGGGGLIANEHFGEMAGLIAEGADVADLTNMYENRWQCKNANNENLFNEFNTQFQRLYAETIKKINKNSGPKILWGVGHNKLNWDTRDLIKWPSWMSKFDLVGVRDYLQGFEWVPCASCMHPAFDKEYKITNKVIWFEHKKQLIKTVDMGSDPVPRFVNTGDNMEQTIELLGSAEIVVTNSYHGVYWATLLGKRVVCPDPWSSKFFHFKHAPIFCKAKDWKDMGKDATRYTTALEECRQANLDFWNKVKKL